MNTKRIVKALYRFVKIFNLHIKNISSSLLAKELEDTRNLSIYDKDNNEVGCMFLYNDNFNVSIKLSNTSINARVLCKFKDRKSVVFKYSILKDNNRLNGSFEYVFIPHMDKFLIENRFQLFKDDVIHNKARFDLCDNYYFINDKYSDEWFEYKNNVFKHCSKTNFTQIDCYPDYLMYDKFNRIENTHVIGINKSPFLDNGLNICASLNELEDDYKKLITNEKTQVDNLIPNLYENIVCSSFYGKNNIGLRKLFVDDSINYDKGVKKLDM